MAQAYSQGTEHRALAGEFSAAPVKGDGRVELLSYRMLNASGAVHPPPGTKEDLVLEVELRVRENIGSSQPAGSVSRTPPVCS